MLGDNGKMSNTKTAAGRLNTVDIVYIAIGAALIAVCSWINIPTTVPFTLQTFAVFLTLLLLGGERGTLATVVYVIMGAIGLPVFSGFKGGAGALLGNTGGYILGFIFMSIVYALIVRFVSDTLLTRIISLMLGLVVCYAFGTGWFMFVYMKNTGPVGVMTVLGWCVIPFIIPDILKLAAAILISKRVKPFIR